jgi:uncharacterized membrane protein YeaQ/YmgE (transglycosylase-associated protein family)
MGHTLEAVMAWVGVGLAAALAGWILPYRRGVAGILMNAAAAMCGAILFAGFGRALGLYRRIDAPAGLGLAAIGALLLLAVTHAAWLRRRRLRFR